MSFFSRFKTQSQLTARPMGLVEAKAGHWFQQDEVTEEWTEHRAFALKLPDLDESRLARISAAISTLPPQSTLCVGLHVQPMAPNTLKRVLPPAAPGLPEVTPRLRALTLEWWTHKAPLGLAVQHLYVWVSRPVAFEKVSFAKRSPLDAFCEQIERVAQAKYVPSSRAEFLSEISAALPAKPSSSPSTSLQCVLKPVGTPRAYAPTMPRALAGLSGLSGGPYWVWLTGILVDNDTAKKRVTRALRKENLFFKRAPEIEALRTLQDHVKAGTYLWQGCLELHVPSSKVSAQKLEAHLLARGFQATSINASPSTGPVALSHPEVFKRHNYLATAVSLVSSMPLDKSPVLRHEGLLLRAHEGTAFQLDPFSSSTNPNLVLTGEAASGKSYLAKAILLELLVQGGRSWAITTSAETEGLANVVGVPSLRLAPGATSGLNPFAFINSKEALEANLGLLLDWFSMFSGGLTEGERHQLACALISNADSSRPLTLTSVVSCLSSSLASRFMDYLPGGLYAGVFEGNVPASYHSDFVHVALNDWVGQPRQLSLIVQTLLLMSALKQGSHQGYPPKHLTWLDDFACLASTIDEGPVQPLLRSARSRRCGFMLEGHPQELHSRLGQVLLLNCGTWAFSTYSLAMTDKALSTLLPSQCLEAISALPSPGSGYASVAVLSEGGFAAPLTFSCPPEMDRVLRGQAEARSS
jgi:hypothetical protein